MFYLHQCVKSVLPFIITGGLLFVWPNWWLWSFVHNYSSLLALQCPVSSFHNIHSRTVSNSHNRYTDWLIQIFYESIHYTCRRVMCVSSINFVTTHFMPGIVHECPLVCVCWQTEDFHHIGIRINQRTWLGQKCILRDPKKWKIPNNFLILWCSDLVLVYLVCNSIPVILMCKSPI